MVNLMPLTQTSVCIFVHWKEQLITRQGKANLLFTRHPQTFASSSIHAIGYDNTKINQWGKHFVTLPQKCISYKPEITTSAVKHPCEIIMIWTRICFSDSGELHIIEGTGVNALYLEILKNTIIYEVGFFYVIAIQSMLLQKRKCWIKTRKIRVLEWISSLTDLNPTENLSKRLTFGILETSGSKLPNS